MAEDESKPPNDSASGPVTSADGSRQERFGRTQWDVIWRIWQWARTHAGHAMKVGGLLAIGVVVGGAAMWFFGKAANSKSTTSITPTISPTFAPTFAPTFYPSPVAQVAQQAEVSDAAIDGPRASATTAVAKRKAPEDSMRPPPIPSAAPPPASTSYDNHGNNYGNIGPNGTQNYYAGDDRNLDGEHRLPRPRKNSCSGSTP